MCESLEDSYPNRYRYVYIGILLSDIHKACACACQYHSNSTNCENTVTESVELPCGLLLTSKKKQFDSILIMALSS